LQDRDGLDLASAIEQSLAVTDDPTTLVRPMMIQDINDTLDRVAASCAFSSPGHRGAFQPGSIDSRTSLVQAFRRMCSVEAKWLVRLLLKDLRPAVMPVPLTLHLFHFMLPDVLRARNTLSGALALLQSAAFYQMPATLSAELEKSSKKAIWPEVKPRAGTMVGLPVFLKARSISIAVNWLETARSAWNASMMGNTVRSIFSAVALDSISVSFLKVAVTQLKTD
jgi:DNA ligase-4